MKKRVQLISATTAAVAEEVKKAVFVQEEKEYEENVVVKSGMDPSKWVLNGKSDSSSSSSSRQGQLCLILVDGSGGLGTNRIM